MFSVAGNNFMCDCRLSWMYLLRNETPNEQILNSLDELTCRLGPEEGDYQDHDSDEGFYSTQHPRFSGPAHAEDLAGGAPTPEPSNWKHLFDIPQDQLPCPEDLQLEADPTFPFELNSEFGQGRDTNSDVKSHVTLSVFVFNAVLMLVT
jgi:hypothetical protein